MEDVQEIIDHALEETFTTDEQLDPASLLRWFNLARKNVAQKITTFVNEKFFYQIWQTDAVAGAENGEYLLPQHDFDTPGALKLFTIGIKPSYTYDYYINAREVDPSALPNDWSYYLENQPKEDPIFYIADNSYFIAPQWRDEDLPTVPAGNKMIKLDGIQSFADLLATDTAALILIPEEYHEVIAVRMERYIYKARSKKQEALIADQDYKDAWKTMVQELTNRNDGQTILATPNEEHLAYGQ